MRTERVRENQSGYSLAEMLTVIAIIGVLSLVSIPQFMNYQRSNQLKGSMQMVMNDLRLARQQAITLRTQTRLRFASNSGQYVVERRDGGNWVPIGRTSAATGTRELANGCTLATPNGINTVDIDDVTYNVVVFRPDGTAEVSGAENNGTFVVRSTFPLARTAYTIDIRPPGFVKAL